MSAKAGIYIHIPFCLRKCPYCDFYSLRYGAETAESYVRAVCRNIEAYKGQGIEADTVYFGGGTPSLLAPGQVSMILDAAHRSFELSGEEITLEANPSSVTPEKLRGWRLAGVNRLSVGFQSADDKQLGFLGRLHDAARAEKAVLEAAEAGFDNISCDLILGSEGQDIGSLDRTLDKMLALPIAHLSAYMLKIEEGTPFDCEDIRRRSADEDTLCALYEHLSVRMAQAGFEHYEISNYARSGKRSRHNMKYWQLAPYIGIGASAHSDFGGRRYFCPPDAEAFISAKVQPTETEDDAPDRFAEYVMLGLRLSEGISLAEAARLGGREAAEAIKRNAAAPEKAGLLRISADRLSLTEKGFLLSNSVIVRLLG